MKLPKVIALLLGTALVPTAAQAESPPRYDAEASCKEMASLGGSYSEFMFNACLDQEQSAYDWLKANWTEFSADARKHCDEMARLGGHGSYFMLQACIQQEERARASRPDFRY